MKSTHSYLHLCIDQLRGILDCRLLLFTSCFPISLFTILVLVSPVAELKVVQVFLIDCFHFLTLNCAHFLITGSYNFLVSTVAKIAPLTVLGTAILANTVNFVFASTQLRCQDTSALCSHKSLH